MICLFESFVMLMENNASYLGIPYTQYYTAFTTYNVENWKSNGREILSVYTKLYIEPASV